MKRFSVKNPILVGAVGVSLVFHVSMVTLFEIVLLFPRENIDYFEFRIVDPRVAEAAVLGNRERLRVPSAQGALERMARDEGEGGVGNFLGSLPPVDLPTIQFAELDLLRLGMQGLEVRSRYRELFDRGPQDAWARFGHQLSVVGAALSRVAGGESWYEEKPRPVSHPAPGFDAYLEWMSEPEDRGIVSASKVEALWGSDPRALEEPIALMFKVNRAGKVVYVLPKAPDDDEGIVESAARSLLRFRFEPIGEDGPAAQHGALVIKAGEAFE